ncbi:TetR/AcrR family transcriptional regulator [Mycolicibacterium sp. 018/SC-01/001]|uniref:TetR/AcrR family transcriptional regulator n=1 Tax=Mycolicibacterium sp. 018/SC-01/001 TaxID=2592069 RepID=UPI00117F9D73|nr:TetR/AcrR family transcriptional regulator [Mycolicibacterium sp. 018/SC-01/001]TRW82459.1 TetR/AcrR family transcriptional regulator [Mycolicibacterium sp. 018/SC-01/001]
MAGPRERMVVSAALLIRERGAQSTAIADVLAHSGAPRGSAYHYFPGGRTQLLCEAVDYAADHMARELDAAPSTVHALDALFSRQAQLLVDSDFRAGCPVVAVAVEAGEPDATERPVLDRAAAAFSRWRDTIAARLRADGATAESAEALAVVTLSAFEGALVLARAARDLEPMQTVHTQLAELIRAKLPAGTRERDPR